jgi:hypothetical protein
LLGLSVPARRDAVYLTRQAWGWRCENLSELRALTCDPTGETALAAKKKATKAKRKVAAKRELIDTGTNKLFVVGTTAAHSKRLSMSAGRWPLIVDKRPKGSLSLARATRATARADHE